MIVGRGVVIYSGDHTSEMFNLSNWFNLISDRDGFYDHLAEPTRSAVSGLYIAHEIVHLVTSTPPRETRSQLADDFDASERLASFETELRVHSDLPALRDIVPWRPLLAAHLEHLGYDLADHELMMAWRDNVIKDPSLLAELPTEAFRLSQYNGNHEWARNHWDRLDRLGWWDSAASAIATPVALGPDWRDHPAIARAEAELDTEHGARRWLEQTARTVRGAHVLCGAGDRWPLDTIDDITHAADDLCASAPTLIPEMS